MFFPSSEISESCPKHVENWEEEHAFLAFVEDGRPRVVSAHLVLVRVDLSAAFVNTLLSHLSRLSDATQNKTSKYSAEGEEGRKRIVVFWDWSGIIAFKILWASDVSTSFSNICNLYVLYVLCPTVWIRQAQGEAAVECTGRRSQGVFVVT